MAERTMSLLVAYETPVISRIQTAILGQPLTDIAKSSPPTACGQFIRLLLATPDTHRPLSICVDTEVGQINSGQDSNEAAFGALVSRLAACATGKNIDPYRVVISEIADDNGLHTVADFRVEPLGL